MIRLWRRQELKTRGPTATRITPGGMVFHVLNRGNDRRIIFEGE
jgi:hypothetical protein